MEPKRSAVITVAELAELADSSTWTIYETIKRGEAPLGVDPIHLGKKILFPRSKVYERLGLS